MKKVLFGIVCILLIVSLVFNVILGFKYFENKLKDKNNEEDDSYIIKYNDKTITKNSFYKDYFDDMSDKVIELVVNDILLSDLNKDELSNAEDETSDTVDSLKDVYGEEIESAVRQYTNYSLDEYKDLLLIYNGYKYRIEKNCKKDCEGLIYSEEKDVLEKSNIKFNNGMLEKAWDSKLNDLDIMIDSYKEAKDKTETNTNTNNTKKEEYEYFKDMTSSGIDSLLNTGNAFVLVVSRTDCSHCATFKPKLANILKNNKVYAYYVDIDLASNDVLESIKDLQEVNATPTTLYINGGVVKDTMVGDLSEDDIKDFLKKNNVIN